MTYIRVSLHLLTILKWLQILWKHNHTKRFLRISVRRRFAIWWNSEKNQILFSPSSLARQVNIPLRGSLRLHGTYCRRIWQSPPLSSWCPGTHQRARDSCSHAVGTPEELQNFHRKVWGSLWLPKNKILRLISFQTSGKFLQVKCLFTWSNCYENWFAVHNPIFILFGLHT